MPVERREHQDEVVARGLEADVVAGEATVDDRIRGSQDPWAQSRPTGSEAIPHHAKIEQVNPASRGDRRLHQEPPQPLFQGAQLLRIAHRRCRRRFAGTAGVACGGRRSTGRTGLVEPPAQQTPHGGDRPHHDTATPPAAPGASEGARRGTTGSTAAEINDKIDVAAFDRLRQRMIGAHLPGDRQQVHRFAASATGNGDDLDRRGQPPHAHDGLETIGERHHQIADHQIRPVRPEQPHGLLAILGLGNLHPGFFEEATQRQTQSGIIVNHKHGWHFPPPVHMEPSRHRIRRTCNQAPMSIANFLKFPQIIRKNLYIFVFPK
ncbi:hypothetical protein COLO4_01495 [Corchorus olitorius]|uniref:Uncharacterized protein n=1 Tax=Corchorus olitorius TaxID=93759 RepID=A0A1R3L2D9_9ROSI|nr:hypothetical protein COLO4_01495 [Corchorus olitorius]